MCVSPGLTSRQPRSAVATSQGSSERRLSLAFRWGALFRWLQNSRVTFPLPALATCCSPVCDVPPFCLLSRCYFSRRFTAASYCVSVHPSCRSFAEVLESVSSHLVNFLPLLFRVCFAPVPLSTYTPVECSQAAFISLSPTFSLSARRDFVHLTASSPTSSNLEFPLGSFLRDSISPCSFPDFIFILRISFISLSLIVIVF